MEGKNNTKAFCFLMPCFGLFFYLLFFPFPFPFPFLLVLVLVLVLVFLAPLRPCVFAFPSSSLPFFQPSLLSLCVRVSVFYG